MKTARILYHLARADFLERARRYSFLVLVAATVYISYVFVPPVESSNPLDRGNVQVILFGANRGLYNSAWIGAMFGIVVATIATLAAFFPLKNTVTLDRQTRVGQILAATPIRKSVYVLGKWLSNLILVAILLSVMTGVGLIMQLVRGENLQLNPLTLASHLWLIGFPTLALVAALAVFFDCIPPLDGGAGNVIYFFIFTLAVPLVGAIGSTAPTSDPSGIAIVLADMQRVVGQHDPAYDGSVEILQATENIQTFPWAGVVWTYTLVGNRLLWVGVAALVAMLGTLFFDRFDTTQTFLSQKTRTRSFPADTLSTLTLAKPGALVSLTPLKKDVFHWRWARVLEGEFLLLLKGQRWWWYAVLVGLNLAGLFAPRAEVGQPLQALAWLWPLLIWSHLGCRETIEATRQLVFSCAYPLWRQLPAQWLAGVCLTMLAGSGFALRLVFMQEWGVLIGWGIGALFIPSLAVALGAWTNSNRLFEVVYLFWWYLGPLNRVPALDFMGTTSGSVPGNLQIGYFLIALGLLILAIFGRWWEGQR